MLELAVHLTEVAADADLFLNVDPFHLAITALLYGKRLPYAI
jgi:hypothetical protein